LDHGPAWGFLHIPWKDSSNFPYSELSLSAGICKKPQNGNSGLIKMLHKQEKSIWLIGLPAGLAAAALSLMIGQGHAAAQSLPSRPGICGLTTITDIFTRLVDRRTGKSLPASGSVIIFANGGQQVSEVDISAIMKSRKRDKVYMCLISLPTDCPPGDNRGREYTTTNLRTMESWTLPDSVHTCGGA